MADPIENETQDSPALVEADLQMVRVFFQTVAKALRTHHLYQGAGPSYDRFLELLRERTTDLWTCLADLTVRIEETKIIWEDEVAYQVEERNDSLAFVLYRDGLRELQLFPGFEDALPAFLSILARAQHSSSNAEDDLITLLWDHDLDNFRYRYVDIQGEGTALDLEPDRAEQPRINTPMVRAEVSSAPSATVSMEDFDSSLFFLDEHELRLLQEEIDREGQRDLWRGVLDGLFDLLENANEDRKSEIVRILCEVLPALLADAKVSAAAEIVRVLAPYASGGDAGASLPEEASRRVREAFASIANAETIVQLITVLEEAREDVPAEELASLLGHLPETALGPLLEAEGDVVSPRLRASLGAAIETMASDHPKMVVRLAREGEEAVAARATRLVGQISLPEGSRLLAQQLQHESVVIRIAAVEGIQSLRSADAARALVAALEDGHRDVRVRAIRAIGALRFAPALDTLRKAVASKRMREVDLTERIAFFEVLGALGSADDIELLDGLLNRKSWLGRRESPELRACAALALGRIGGPEAREVLARSDSDGDPVVRNAVGKAIREMDHA